MSLVAVLNIFCHFSYCPCLSVSLPEPDIASSDATNMECTMHKDKDHYVINGKKWWSSGRCSFSCILYYTCCNSAIAFSVSKLLYFIRQKNVYLCIYGIWQVSLSRVMYSLMHFCTSIIV